MRLFNIAALTILLTINLMSHSPCFASNSANSSLELETYPSQSIFSSSKLSHGGQNSGNNIVQELEDSESAKKPQSENSSLELDQGKLLPGEIWAEILDHSNFRDLGQIQQVSRKWMGMSAERELSLAIRLINHSPSHFLKEVEDSRINKTRLFENLLATPTTCRELLSGSSIIDYILQKPSLIPILFKSEVTALKIHQIRRTLDSVQQTELEAYAKKAPLYSEDKGIFSQEFVGFARAYEPHYKAFYLLNLCNIRGPQPMVDLLLRIHEAIGVNDIYEYNSLYQVESLPRAMDYFFKIHRQGFNKSEFLYEWLEKSFKETR